MVLLLQLLMFSGLCRVEDVRCGVLQTMFGAIIGLFEGTNADDRLNKVALSGDGNTVAFGLDGKNGDDQSSVKVYTYSNNAFTQKGTTQTFSSNGARVALNDDGSILAIGSFNKKDAADSKIGEVNVYEFKDDDWSSFGNFLGEDKDQCGLTVDLNRDGTILAYGCQQYLTDGKKVECEYINIHQVHGQKLVLILKVKPMIDKVL